MLLPRRQQAPRLKTFNYRAPRAYFVTACTKARSAVLSTVVKGDVVLTGVGAIIRDNLLSLPARHIGLTLDTYVVMPDHIHAILWLPREGRLDLRQVVGLYKAGCTREARALMGAEQDLWQRSFYERVIRSPEELDALRRYIGENPLRWSLRLRAG